MTRPWKPRGVERIVKAFPTYRSRMDFDGEVIVSLCGQVSDKVTADFTVYADPDRDHDWSDLRRLSVLLVVRKGIDATRTVRALWDIAEPFIQILDIDTGAEAAVIQLDPKLRLWHKRKDLEPLPHPNWKTATSAEKSRYFRAAFQGWGIQ